MQTFRQYPRQLLRHRDASSFIGATSAVDAYAFLPPSDGSALKKAEADAQRWGVTIEDALFAAGHVDEDRYTRALAAALTVPVASSEIDIPAEQVARSIVKAHAFDMPAVVAGMWLGTPVRAICATGSHPATVAAVVRAETARPGAAVVLIAAAVLRRSAEKTCSAAIAHAATYGLRRSRPHMSAGHANAVWQPALILLVLSLISFCMLLDAHATMAWLGLGMALPFSGTVVVKLVALIGQVWRYRAQSPPLRHGHDQDLPYYSVLIALYDEARIVPSLAAALGKIDYPAAKLDGIILLEDTDAATKLAMLETKLPSWLRVVVVPDGRVRTKPRALNYGLALARGEFVVIFDAEDRPEPDQLRRACAAFRASDERLACVQASLNIFNARQTWLTRQFSIEYSALFDATLPALQWLRLPVPLGGTSNHFRRATLDDMAGWDPFNVTEDADLGIRIARLGRNVGTIPSTTWEEAPSTFPMWLRQRTRWLKGWMQTYLVHTRQPLALFRDLGLFRALGFHLYFGGLILSSVVHPLFYAGLIAIAVLPPRSGTFDAGLGQALWGLAAANLCLGYMSSIIVGAMAARRRGHRLVLSALIMPFYWLLISLAAYRALLQLFVEPYRWEKTPHGLAEED